MRNTRFVLAFALILGLCAATGLQAVDTERHEDADQAGRLGRAHRLRLRQRPLDGRPRRPERPTPDRGRRDGVLSRLLAGRPAHRLQRPVRRQCRRLRRPGRRRRSQAPDLASVGRHRPGLHAGRPVGPVRLEPFLKQPRLLPALHRARRGRRGGHAQGALRLRRRDLTRRPVHRLLPLPRSLQSVEELPRRPLFPHLDLQCPK